ncbi:hypothetical protein DFJ74DRAFT_296677 [Hyaloraphidium curvatum]|nr:hypothetical protein DFJ74DRAFT_296677 [Hyaloraphidium curvatum]
MASTDALPGRFSLDASGLLAIFPLPVPGNAPPPYPRSLGPGDVRSKPNDVFDTLAAGAAPLTPVDVIRRLEDAGLKALAILVRACGTPAVAPGLISLCGIATTALVIAISATMFPLNDGSFGTAQIAVAVASVGALFLGGACTVVVVVFALAAARRGSSNRPAYNAWFAATLTQTCRWLELCEPGRASKLVEHVPGDQYCTCRDCCAGLLRLAVWDRVVRPGLFHTLAIFIFFVPLWTPLVRFGPVFWSRWYGMALGIAFIVAEIAWNLTSALTRVSASSTADVRLRTRIYRRATDLALRDFLARARAALLHGTAVDGPGTTELYASLHAAYESRWRAARAVTAFSSNAFTTIISVLYPLLLVAGAVANIAVGSCIPLWLLLFLLLTFALLFIDLAQLPAANDQIDAVLSLYIDARTALQSMLAESARLGTRTAARELKEHLGLLASFGASDNLRATFVGIVVTWGLAKTAVVTVVTLAVALWSVLRGVGVGFTVETACPLG